MLPLFKEVFAIEINNAFGLLKQQHVG